MIHQVQLAVNVLYTSSARPLPWLPYIELTDIYGEDKNSFNAKNGVRYATYPIHPLTLQLCAVIFEFNPCFRESI